MKKIIKETKQFITYKDNKSNRLDKIIKQKERYEDNNNGRNKKTKGR